MELAHWLNWVSIKQNNNKIKHTPKYNQQISETVLDNKLEL